MIAAWGRGCQESPQRLGPRAVARYTLLSDGSLALENTCIAARGRCRSFAGRAEVVPGSGNARLRVRFEGIVGLVGP